MRAGRGLVPRRKPGRTDGGSVENVSLKDGNVSLSALSPSGIYSTMAHSAADDALAYSDGARSREGCAGARWIMKTAQRGN